MKTKIILLTAVCSLTIGSCNENDLYKKNGNNKTTESYYKNDSELSAALIGSYALLQSNNLGGREYFFLHDLRSDDVATGGSQLETPRAQILTGVHGPSNSVLSGVFANLYKVVLRTNAILENAPTAIANNGEALKARHLAEARFLRAWAYYQLAGFWGGVPLNLSFGKTLNDLQPRSTQDEIFDFVITELEDIKEGLPPSYDAADRGRATKGAALTLLAKVYMFKQDFNKAKTQLEAVKALGYGLVDNYFDNFSEETEFNKESIFEIVYTSSGNYNWDGDGNGTGTNESWIRSQEYSAVGWRNLIPSSALLAAFEDDDPRLNDNFYFIGDEYGDPADPVILTDDKVNGNTSIFKGEAEKVSWKKYSVMYKLDPGGFYDKIGINYRMFRYADVVLMLAECENEVGTADNAIDYLNQIRNRASVSMPEYPTAGYPVDSKKEIMKAIMHERQVEFAGEEIRNFDILRWRKGSWIPEEFADPISYFAANKYEYLPIPQDEINGNPNIGQANQNPGY